jgi:hypothetical protein
MKIAIDINDVIRDNMYMFMTVYQKFIDPDFEINPEDIDSFDQMEVYPFEDRDDLAKFKYIDYPYELFGRAPCCDKMLPYVLNDWLEKTLRDLDEENVPEVMFFSPFEMGLSIQSTFSFLSGNTFRVRELYFPMDSSTIYDRADIVITAQPSLIENCPEDKVVIKVNKPYNKEIETKYSFDSLMDIINDENETVIKILEHRN